MRMLSVVIVFLVAIPLLPQAAKLPPGTPGEQKDLLLKMENEIGRAMLECNRAYFEQIQAEEFIFTDAAGHVSQQRQEIGSWKNCRKSAGTYVIDDSDVRLYPLSAVVTGRVTMTFTNAEGKVVTRRSRFTDVFIWQDGMWELAAGHSSRIL